MNHLMSIGTEHRNIQNELYNEHKAIQVILSQGNEKVFDKDCWQ